MHRIQISCFKASWIHPKECAQIEPNNKTKQKVNLVSTKKIKMTIINWNQKKKNQTPHSETIRLLLAVDAASKLIRFDVKGIDPKEHVEKAEIRINFQKIVGQVFSDDKLGSCGLYDKKTGRLITKSALQGADPNWIVFPMVETAVVQWFQSIDTVHEVQVKVVSDSADDSVPKPLISNTTNGNSDGVFMVVYTDGRQLQEVEYDPFLGR